MNIGMLASFDQIKAELTERRVPYASGGAAMLASFVCAFCTTPFELMKIRVQDGRDPGVISAFRGQVARQGVTGLWAGFTPFAARTVPHALLTLLLMDALKARAARTARV
jgi:hypothetical protein